MSLMEGAWCYWILDIPEIKDVELTTVPTHKETFL